MSRGFTHATATPAKPGLCTTIFLATTGQHVILGRGDDADLTDATLAGIRAQGLSGFVAILDGSYHAKRAPAVTLVRSVDGTPQRHWRGAVSLLLATRAS